MSKNQTYLTRLRGLRDITYRETYMLSTWYLLSKLDSGGVEMVTGMEVVEVEGDRW